MHRHIAELAVSLVANHRVVKQVALVYVSGGWVLMSTENVGTYHEAVHSAINDCDLQDAADRLDAQVAQWRAAGHDVRCDRRRVAALPT